METAYLNNWTAFESKTSGMLPQIKKLVYDNKHDTVGQLKALRALSAIKQDALGVRERILLNLRENFCSGKIPQDALVDGLVGLADSSTRMRLNKEIINQVANLVDNNLLSFDQRVDAMHSLAILGAPKGPAKSLLADIIKSIDRLTFERIENELTSGQYDKLMEANLSLRKQHGMPALGNKKLRAALDSELMRQVRYPEHEAKFDPLRSRVVAGLVEGLNADPARVHANQ